MLKQRVGWYAVVLSACMSGICGCVMKPTSAIFLCAIACNPNNREAPLYPNVSALMGGGVRVNSGSIAVRV